MKKQKKRFIQEHFPIFLDDETVEQHIVIVELDRVGKPIGINIIEVPKFDSKMRIYPYAKN